MNEIQTKQTNQIASAIPAGLSFGFESVTTKDIKIPLIYVAQAMSKVVDAGSARAGEIVENMENKVLGGKDKPARVVPFYFQKAYQVQKIVDGKKVFHGIESYDGEREYMVEKDGVTYLNYPCFNFFVLVYGDETYSKYMLSFRGARNITSAGRPMLTQLMNQVQRGIPPFATVYEIGVKQVENDKGKWYVFTSSPNRELTVGEQTFSAAAREAKNLQEMFKQGATINTGESVIEDDSEEAPF